MKPAYILAFIILAVSMVVTLFAFSGSIARHVTIQQAISKPGERVQVPGKIIKKSVNYDARKGELRFKIAAIDGAGAMTIVYAQPKPENFDSATSVEAVGQYRDGAFYAENLLVKCPSKYNDTKPKQTSGVDPALLLGLMGTVCVAPLMMLRRGDRWKSAKSP